MIQLLAELVQLLIDGIQSAEKAADDKDAAARELVALELAQRKIQTEIAKRQLPP